MAGTLSARKPRSLLPWGSDGFQGIREEMEDLLSRFRVDDPEGWLAATMKPSADLSETDNAFQMRMDLPGVEAKDINIQINNNLLTVSGERKEEKEEKGRTFHRVERRSGSFSRVFTLPTAVVEDEVAAEYKDGILTITMPKTEESQPRKIQVKT